MDQVKPGTDALFTLPVARTVVAMSWFGMTVMSAQIICKNWRHARA